MVIRWSDESKFAEDARDYRATSRVDLAVRDTSAVKRMDTV